MIKITIPSKEIIAAAIIASISIVRWSTLNLESIRNRKYYFYPIEMTFASSKIEACALF
jgi:hypothetical protein